MELTIDMIRNEFKGFEGQIKSAVGELTAAASAESKTKIEAMEKQLGEMRTEYAKIEEKLKAANTQSVPGTKEEIEKKGFSFQSLICALHKKSKGESDPFKEAGFEKEVCDQYAKTKANNTAGDGSAGGFLVSPEAAAPLVDLAMAATPILQLPVMMLRGLVGDLPIPRLTGRPTAYWVGENSKPTSSGITLGQLQMRPKKLGAFTKQSNRLIYQSRGAAESAIRQELSNAMALKLNEGLTRGTGSSYQPLGIMNTTGFTTSSVGTTGTLNDRATINDLAKMAKDLDVADEYNEVGTNYAYLMRPEVKSGLKRERVAQYSGQAASAGMPVINPLVSDEVLRSLLGHDFRTTTQILATEAGKGGSATGSKVLFGNWRYFWVGMWRDFVIKVSDVAGDGSTGSALLDDEMYIVTFQEVDCAAVRPSAFTQCTGAETNEAIW